jgi:hypothetical protein
MAATNTHHQYRHSLTYEISRFANLDIRNSIYKKVIFKKWDGGAWTGLIWLSIGAGGGLL